MAFSYYIPCTVYTVHHKVHTSVHVNISLLWTLSKKEGIEILLSFSIIISLYLSKMFFFTLYMYHVFPNIHLHIHKKLSGMSLPWYVNSCFPMFPLIVPMVLIYLLSMLSPWAHARGGSIMPSGTKRAI